MIDVHTHFMLPEHWGDEFTTNWQPVHGFDWPVVTADDYDRAMAPVETAIVFGIRATAAGVGVPNKAIAEFCRQTKTNTIGFMALDLSDDDVLDQLDEGVGLGLRGIKLYPVLAGFSPVDPKHERFYRAVESHGLVLLWHMGTTPSPRGDLSLSQPLLLDQIATRYPGIRQIIAHMGHPWQRDTIVLLRKHRNLYADVSGQWRRTLEGYLALVHAQEWGVVDRLLFGSDYPFWTPHDAAHALHKLTTISTGDLPKVQTDTVETILSCDALGKLGLS